MDKQKIISVVLGVVLYLIIQIVFWYYFASFAITDDFKDFATTNGEINSNAYLSMMGFILLSFLFLFAIPPKISSLYYCIKTKKADYKELYIISLVTTFIAFVLSFVILEFYPSEKDRISIFLNPMCILLSIIWLGLSALVGPITVFMKKKLFEKNT